MDKVLVTGAFGQIGSELWPVLARKYGLENVILLGHKNISADFKGIVEQGTILDKELLSEIIKKHEVNTIFHLVSILSAKGEIDPQDTWRVNMEGLQNILNIAAKRKIKMFWPSSIAVFGKESGRVNVPQYAYLMPTTMYGVTKVAGEELCNYYFHKYRLDVRSIRFPGIISYKTEPGGGTTDYAVGMYYAAVKKEKYTCFVRRDTVLPMMYMEDAISATLSLMSADTERIKIRTSYNITALSFSVKDLEKEIQKFLPLKINYIPDERQKIADSWPQTIDDSYARKDWAWKPQYDLTKMTKIMIKNLKVKL